MEAGKQQDTPPPHKIQLTVPSRAKYDFLPSSQEPNSLTFKKGDIIYILTGTKYPSGWCQGYIESTDAEGNVIERKKGWVPYQYVELLADDPSSSIESVASPSLRSTRSSESMSNRSSGVGTEQGSLVSERPPLSRQPSLSRQTSLDKLTVEIEQKLVYGKKEERRSGGSQQLELREMSSRDERHLRSDRSESNGNVEESGRKSDEVTNWVYAKPVSTRGEIYPRREEDGNGSLNAPPAGRTESWMAAWRKKLTPDGREYYYNELSNETSWSVEDAISKKASTMTRHRRSMSAGRLLNEALFQNGTSSPSSPDGTTNPFLSPNAYTPGGQLSWDTVVRKIVNTIGELNEAVRTNQKNRWLHQSTLITLAIRYLLLVTGCHDVEQSEILRASSNMRNHYSNVTRALNELTVAVRLASGVWPPPDASENVRKQSAQLLMTVRQFVVDAIEWKKIKPRITEEVLELEQIERTIRLGSQNPNTLPPRPLIVNRDGKFVFEEAGVSDGELITRLDEFLAELRRVCERATQRLEQAVNNGLPPAAEDFVVPTRNVAIETSHFMSFLDEYRLDRIGAGASAYLTPEDNANIARYRETYNKLKDNIIALNYAIAVAGQNLPPPDALAQVLHRNQLLLKSIKDVVVSAKYLLEHKNMKEHQEMSRGVEAQRPESGEVLVPPRRAMSLNFLEKHDAGELPPPTTETSTSNPNLVLNDMPEPSTPPVSAAPTVTPDRRKTAFTSSNNKPLPVLTPRSVSQQNVSTKERELKQVEESPKLRKFFGEAVQEKPRDQRKEKREGLVMGKDKLKKFFGEMPPKEVEQVREEPKAKPWYLEPEYKAPDIIFNLDGDNRIKGGTLPALVERLTSHDEYDSDLAISFLLTFRSFTTPSEFLTQLISRFTLPIPSPLTPEELSEWTSKKLHPTQSHVLEVIRLWLERFWDPREDLRIVPSLREFLTESAFQVQPDTARKILEFLDRPSVKLVRRSRSRTIYSLEDLLGTAGGSGNSSTENLSVDSQQPPSTSTTAPSSGTSTPVPEEDLTLLDLSSAPPSILPRHLRSFRLSELDPLEIARQLTIIEFQTFERILPGEWCQYKPETKRKTKSRSGSTGTLNGDKGEEKAEEDRSPNIRRMIHQSNQITGWVAETILVEKDVERRAGLVKLFIKIAERCHDLHNFSTREAVLAALNSTPIYRLKRTWAKVSSKARNTQQELMKHMDRENNFLNYRNSLRSVRPPCIPFLGIYLTDLTFIADGNPSTLVYPSSKTPLINFDKHHRTAHIITDIHKFQSVPYILNPVKEVQQFLWKQLMDSRDVQELHELSLRMEPREKEGEWMMRLLQEKGFV